MECKGNYLFLNGDLRKITIIIIFHKSPALEQCDFKVKFENWKVELQ